jgi:hypothetical protein
VSRNISPASLSIPPSDAGPMIGCLVVGNAALCAVARLRF